VTLPLREVPGTPELKSSAISAAGRALANPSRISNPQPINLGIVQPTTLPFCLLLILSILL